MGRVFERTRHFGLMLVLAIIATFTVAIPSANAATVSTVFPESGPNVGGTPHSRTHRGIVVTRQSNFLSRSWKGLIQRRLDALTLGLEAFIH